MKEYYECRVSIIIASFNANKFLERAILSILNQGVGDIQIIIVDGGSLDGTIEIIRKYNSSIDYWISEKDEGIYDAWNKGLEYVKGEWVLFLGADDRLVPDALKDYLRFIELNSEQGKCLFNFVSSKILYSTGEIQSAEAIGNKWNWTQMKLKMIIAHPGSLHHESLFHNSVRFNKSLKIAGDYEFLLRMGKLISGGFMNKATVIMETGCISSSHSSGNQIYLEAFKAKMLSRNVSFISAYYYLLGGFVKGYLRRLLRGDIKLYIL